MHSLKSQEKRLDEKELTKIPDVEESINFFFENVEIPRNKEIVKVDKYYPSSQICHVCEYRNRDIKDLSIREWICPKCNTIHDRDVNAAINILNEGFKIYCVHHGIT